MICEDDLIFTYVRYQNAEKFRQFRIRIAGFMMPTSQTFRSLIGCYYLVLSILAPIVLSGSFPWDNFQETCRPTCESKECQAMSQDLSNCVKQSVDPCKDFYEYVCGNWKKHRDLERYLGHLDLESILQYNAYKKLRSKLEEPVKSHEDPETLKAKQLYHHCMKLPYLEKVDEDVLREHMKTYGVWAVPSKQQKTVESWLPIHNHYLSISGDSAFFQIDLFMPEDGIVPYIRLQRTRSHYGALHHIHEWQEEQRRSYITFLEKVIKMVAGSEASKLLPETLEDDLRDVFHFRLALQKMSISKVDPKISTHLKIKELSRWYSEGKGCPESGIGHINWLDVFHAFYKNNPDMSISDATTIHVHSKDYLHGLCSLLTHTRQRTVVNHLHLYFMERHIALKPELKKLLFHAITQGLVSSGTIRYITEQWYSCIQHHNMQSVLGSLYTKLHLAESKMKQTTYMIDYIKEVIILQLQNVKWLSESAKKGTIGKLNHMKFVIGYPNERDSKISKETISRIKETSAQPYAFYNVHENVMFISSVYFQPPIFDENLPFTVTYAALGSLIAHEMYHMFDDQAISSGELHQIWGRKAAKHYKENAECFIDHYSKYPVKELEYRMYNKPRVNGQLTRHENIADVMGLKTSYNAYKRMVWTRKGICPTLRDFKNLPCDKLFFIAYARTFCSVIPEETLVRRLSNAHHSPNRFRVNIPVSSMPEFARAFKCELETPMNPYDKCDLWG